VRSKCDFDLRSIAVENNRPLTDHDKDVFILRGKSSFNAHFSKFIGNPLFFVSSPVMADPVTNLQYLLQEEELKGFLSQKIAEHQRDH